MWKRLGASPVAILITCFQVLLIVKLLHEKILQIVDLSDFIAALGLFRSLQRQLSPMMTFLMLSKMTTMARW